MSLILRSVYSVLMWLLLPSTLFYLIWRGLKQSAYLERWSERFALYAIPGEQSCLWLHAVSVGEFNAIIPLVRQLQKKYPDQKILITTTTPTGSARVQQIFGDSVRHVYLPYDTPGAVRHFYEHFRPRLGLIVETELWPNLYRHAAENKIPLAVVNGRISPKSMKAYQILKPIMQLALNDVTSVLAQSDQDGHRFMQIGLRKEKLNVVGNLKFDTDLPAEKPDLQRWRQQNQPRPVWIAASTHPGEHKAVFDAHELLMKNVPNALLIIAPRHPEAFSSVKSELEKRQWRYQIRSQQQWPGNQAQVFLLDTMGELFDLFAAADVAFVGGSFIDIGGHNVLEPAAHGLPVLIGPYSYHFTDSVQLLTECGACLQVEDSIELAKAVEHFLLKPDEAKQRGMAGKQTMQAARGALYKTISAIDKILGKTPT
jgi:3-deoxy-D-manno-octulosonic-acid transferase